MTTLFSPQFRQKFAWPTDELAVVRIGMKLSCCWSENDTWWKKIIRISHWPVPSGLFLPFMVWFILMEAKEEGAFIVLQGVSDSVAMIAIIIRGAIILRYGKDVYRLNEMLATDFKYYERYESAVRIKRSPVVWIPSLANALVCLSSFIMCSFAFMAPGKVKTSARVTRQLEANPLLFRILLGIFMFGHWAMALLNLIMDGLIICTATVMQEKAATLKNMLASLKREQDSEKQNKKVDEIVKYHALICTLHKKIAKICSGPLLVQFMFFVISLGAPILRLLKSDITTTSNATVSFLCSYVVWCTSQLTVYCVVCDDATSACSSIGTAAYGSYRPETAPNVAKKLVIVMARSDRPLHFTARKMFKINRKLLLKLLKRSYSLYSAILRKF